MGIQITLNLLYLSSGSGGERRIPRSGRPAGLAGRPDRRGQLGPARPASQACQPGQAKTSKGLSPLQACEVQQSKGVLQSTKKICLLGFGGTCLGFLHLRIGTKAVSKVKSRTYYNYNTISCYIISYRLIMLYHIV